MFNSIERDSTKIIREPEHPKTKRYSLASASCVIKCSRNILQVAYSSVPDKTRISPKIVPPNLKSTFHKSERIIQITPIKATEAPRYSNLLYLLLSKV